MADAYGDLLHDLWIREMSPAAAGDGSLSLSLMIPSFPAAGRPRSGTATSSFPRKLLRPLGAIASPIPARTNATIVANCETVTTWFNVTPSADAAPSMTTVTPSPTTGRHGRPRSSLIRWENWPARQPCLLFAYAEFGDEKYFDLWKKLEADPLDLEIRRNMAVTQPILWIASPAGIPLLKKPN